MYTTRLLRILVNKYPSTYGLQFKMSFCFVRKVCYSTSRQRKGLCLNCLIDWSRCTCHPEYDGPRCQQTSRGFRGSGWAWYPGLQVCQHSHISLEFITATSEGVLLYNGPLTSPNPNKELVPGIPYIRPTYSLVKLYIILIRISPQIKC